MATTQISNTDIKTFHIAKGEKGNHGNLFWSVTCGKENKAHPRIQVSNNKNPLKAPFGLTSFGENDRQNLDVSIHDPATQKFFRDLDKWCIEHYGKEEPSSSKNHQQADKRTFFSAV